MDELKRKLVEIFFIISYKFLVFGIKNLRYSSKSRISFWFYSFDLILICNKQLRIKEESFFYLLLELKCVRIKFFLFDAFQLSIRRLIKSRSYCNVKNCERKRRKIIHFFRVILLFYKLSHYPISHKSNFFSSF